MQILLCSVLIPHFVPKTSSLATVNCAIYDMHHSKCPLSRVTALLEKVVVNCFVIKRLAVNNVNTKCFVSCIWSVETKGLKVCVLLCVAAELCRKLSALMPCLPCEFAQARKTTKLSWLKWNVKLTVRRLIKAYITRREHGAKKIVMRRKRTG